MTAGPGDLDHVEYIGGAAGESVLEGISTRRGAIEEALGTRGAVLLRGFAAPAPDTAAQALRRLDADLLDDTFWSTPRSDVSNKTVTATEHPKARTIALHSEMADTLSWPRLLCFHAIEVAQAGGETTLASVDDVSAELGELLDPFGAKGVTYRRTYHVGVDVPWQKAFRTEDAGGLEAIAKRAGMTASWLPGDILQTTHTAQGCVRAEDGRWLWFNQGHVFHHSTLPEQHRTMLAETFGEDQLPRHATFGDGTPIPASTIQAVHAALQRHARALQWQEGDVLLLDNMRALHGRLPFKGDRRLHVALANAHADPVRTPVVPESL